MNRILPPADVLVREGKYRRRLAHYKAQLKLALAKKKRRKR